ncbi:SgcJ/EcaC family oxidoreductase, partial [Streptomyces sp. V2]|uniref:SgcJ/EcaC family oxidoreductase n=1 Tax=Streptomyces TaxID=1883 RepID=UPI0006EBC2F0
MTGADTILGDGLTMWERHFNAADPRSIADLFAPDAIFQGLTSGPGFGRDDIVAYYSAIPEGTTVRVRVQRSHRFTANVVSGVARAVFTGADGAERDVILSVVLGATGKSWFIQHYHASELHQI